MCTAKNPRMADILDVQRRGAKALEEEVLDYVEMQVFLGGYTVLLQLLGVALILARIQ